MRFIEVYPCSEGFVATEDPRYDLLRVVPDHGIFFEFVPMDEFEDGQAQDRPSGATYAGQRRDWANNTRSLVTTCAGLWSYQLGDTVAFERRDPPLIRFTGRTKYFLSAFGEHLISEEVTKAIAEAAHETGAVGRRVSRRASVLRPIRESRAIINT